MTFIQSSFKPETPLSNREQELAALMRAANQGDQAAYRRLLETVAVSVGAAAGLALARTGRGAAEAEDIVRETLLAIHAKRATWNPKRPIVPWLCAIALKKLVDRLRRHRRRGTVPVEAILDTLDAPEPSERFSPTP